MAIHRWGTWGSEVPQLVQADAVSPGPSLALDLRSANPTIRRRIWDQWGSSSQTQVHQPGATGPGTQVFPVPSSALGGRRANLRTTQKRIAAALDDQESRHLGPNTSQSNLSFSLWPIGSEGKTLYSYLSPSMLSLLEFLDFFSPKDYVGNLLKPISCFSEQYF